MKPEQIADTLRGLIAQQQPAFIWGEPGIGKSEVIHQVAADLGRAVFDFRAVQRETVDLRGGMMITPEGFTRWCQPDELPRDGSGVFFADELPQAATSMQGALLQLVRDRKIGEYTLPAGWQIVAAGNRVQDRAGANRIISPLASRFVHLNFEIDMQQWCKWAIKSNGKIRPEVIAYIRWRPANLHVFNPGALAFPCPRTWEFASRVIDSKPSADVEIELLTGTIGEGCAVELAGFLRMYRQLVSPDVVLANPGGAPVPDAPDVRFAMAGAIAARATADNFDRVITYAKSAG